LIYTLLVIPCSFLLIYPLGQLGIVYGAIAAFLGFGFLKKVWQLYQNPSDLPLAKATFKYSILYMMLLCTGMVIDSLPLTHHAIASLSQLMNHIG
jgi:protoheme IX farnesyltransferase